MKARPFLLILLLLILLASLYVFKPNPLKSTYITGTSMGTFYKITIAHKKNCDLVCKNFLSKIIKHKLDELDLQMSTYKQTSIISQFNRHKSIEKFLVTKEIIKVVTLAVKIYNLSHGAFNVAIDPLIDLWGFDKSGRHNKIPTHKKIKEALRNTQLSSLIVGDHFLQKTNPNLSINLSGIAKGFIVDEIAGVLKKQNLDNFLVEIGGEIVASGQNLNNPWVIGIEDPNNIGKISHTVELRNQALASSGTYINYFTDKEGNKYTHIINPTTGYPVKDILPMVSIIAPSCMLADALATTCMLLGKTACGNLVGKFENTHLLDY